MSYINQALRRAQQTRDNPYVAYRQFIEAEEELTPPVHRKVLLVSLGSVLVLAVILLIVLVVGIPFGGIERQAQTKTEAPMAEKAAKEILPPVGVEESHPKIASLFAKALESHRLRQFAEAQGLYEQIIAARPDHKMSLNNLGVIFLEKGEEEKARQFFEQARKVDPSWAEPHYNLACLAARLGRPKEAIEHLQQAATIYPAALQWAATDEDLRNVRLLPEYEKLMAK